MPYGRSEFLQWIHGTLSIANNNWKTPLKENERWIRVGLTLEKNPKEFLDKEIIVTGDNIKTMVW